MVTENLFRSGALAYFVGIKGTGVCALAELMHNAGIKCRGSDIPEVFFTDEILKSLDIPFYNNFDANHIDASIDVVIHSAAYSAETNPELERAASLNIPIVKYSDALGAWSAKFNSAGVCGVHGKTTTTAICGVLSRAFELPAQILTGSGAVDFGNRSTLNLGNKYFIAETCEYRRHFLSFCPKRIILTSVESDHQDYFPDYESIRNAFVEYCRLLPKDGELIYCADDAGASEVARIIESENRGIKLTPYGFTAAGDYKINYYKTENERGVFSINCIEGDIKMRIPGRHQALNTAAATALNVSLAKEELGENSISKILTKAKITAIKKELENFKSTKRRSEIIGEAGGIIFMDDYGHHPTEIKTTLSGIKSFYPNRRLIASFMSHTYTRTSALLKEFANAFNDADIMYFHKIFASAREVYTGGVNGKTLCDETAQVRSNLESQKETFYIDEVDDAFEPLCRFLKPGDIFLTLGAGNNWPLAEKLFEHFKGKQND